MKNRNIGIPIVCLLFLITIGCSSKIEEPQDWARETIKLAKNGDFETFYNKMVFKDPQMLLDWIRESEWLSEGDKVRAAANCNQQNSDLGDEDGARKRSMIRQFGNLVSHINELEEECPDWEIVEVGTNEYLSDWYFIPFYELGVLVNCNDKQLVFEIEKVYKTDIGVKAEWYFEEDMNEYMSYQTKKYGFKSTQ